VTGFASPRWEVPSGQLDTGPSPVTGVRVEGGAVVTQVDTGGGGGVAVLRTDDVPEVVPVLVGRRADPTVVADHDGTLTIAARGAGSALVRPVATAESTPFFGPAGMLVDFTMFTRDNPVFDDDVTVHILARADTPQSVVNALAGQGIIEEASLDQTRALLDQDAYALALKLYLVITVIVIALAAAGLAVSTAVQLPARRRDTASLRVVGVPRRTLMAAAVADVAAVLAVAAVAGVASGAVAQYLVVRTLTLGYADNLLTPRVLSSLDVGTVVTLVAVTVAAMVCAAGVLGALTVRGARAATLRDNTV
jgi:ABC-type antimicrobial peptide transport system permease subunit